MRAFRPRPRPLPALVLLVLALPLPAAAQTPIRVGQTVAGRLTIADQRFADSSRYKQYSFESRQGDTISAELVSDDFDANLLLADGSGNTVKRNDDGGVNCNARLTYVVPRAGTYRLYANSSAGAELGAYRLSLARGTLTAVGDTTCRGFGRVAGLVQVGQTVTGTLTAEDPEFPGDSTYFQRWILPVTPAQPFTVDLESSEFDAYLILLRGRSEELVKNDDGGTGCNARAVYTATDDRPLRVIVNSASRPPYQTGRFTLRVSRGASPIEPKGNCPNGMPTARSTPPARPATAGGTGGGPHSITVGQTQRGTLSRNDVLVSSDSTYAQAWTIQGRAGQTVTIDIESEDFDAYLFLRGPGISGGRDYQDDDSGGNCNARLTATFPQTGEYEVVVNTTGTKYATGSFALSVTSGSKPKSLARCSRSQ